MNSWRPYPLLRLLFPFLAGIMVELSSGSFGIGYGCIVATLLCLQGLLFLFSTYLKIYRFRWFSGVMINLFLFIAGNTIADFHNTSNDPSYIGHDPNGLFLATLTEPPSIRKSSFKVVLDIRYHRRNGRWDRCRGFSVGFLKYDTTNPVLQYGDNILLHASLLKLNDNSNPHSFNYTRYLNNKNIYHQVFAGSADWKLIKLKPGGLVRKIAFQLRDRLLNILRDNKVTGKEFAVASALLLGYVDELDADLRRDYAATGAMHILSVSGMHVGIIYVFLEFLLGFMNKRKAGRFLKAIILLVFVWFYALITGLSPCVFRSAAMLSLPILAKSMNRSPEMFNVIAASIFILLAVDPFLLLDVGFQLSYLAVAGIVLLYKPIYDLFITSLWLPDKIWSILAISIAAQIATLPITLYTFHQFPNYFMLTNIFVVPLSSLIIYVGILLMVIGAIPVVSVLCAKLLIALVWLLNSIIHFIEQLPCSTLRGIHISSAEMVILYLVICSCFLYLIRRRISFLYLFLFTCIGLNLMLLDFKLNRLGSVRFLVYNSNRPACFQISMQDKAVSFYYGTNLYDPASLKTKAEMVSADLYAHGIRYHRAYWFGRKDRTVDLSGDFSPVRWVGRFIQFRNFRIAILNKSIPGALKQTMQVDFLILSGNPKIRIAEVIKLFHPKQIIIDATNSRVRILQWLKDSAMQSISCQSVTYHGAFEKEFLKDVGNSEN